MFNHQVSVMHTGENLSLMLFSFTEGNKFKELKSLTADAIRISKFLFDSSEDLNEIGVVFLIKDIDRYGQKENVISLVFILKKENYLKINWKNMVPENFFYAVYSYDVSNYKYAFKKLTGLNCIKNCVMG
jgi:hypothetical protein|tara:strand:- start:1524 stop:1913 length:390 start_codon:yes stop_codon:yes gene_type:complete